MKIKCTVVFLVFFLSSCATYKATVSAKKQDNVNFSSIRVNPEWQFQKLRGRLIAPLIFTAAGAGIGYSKMIVLKNGVSSGENAATFGLYGLLAGGVVNLFISGKARSRKFEMEDSGKWLKEYNKSIGANYVIRNKEADNSLVLVPGEIVERARIEYGQTVQAINDEKFTLRQLIDIKNSSPGKYEYLFPSEAKTLSGLIDSRISAVAKKELTKLARSAANSDNSLTTLKSLKNFYADNNHLYVYADESTRTEANNVINKKAKQVIQVLMMDEKEALQKIPDGENGLALMKIFSKRFHTHFDLYKDDYKEITEISFMIMEKNTAIVRGLTRDLHSKINTSLTVTNLDRIYQNYLLNTVSTDPVIIELEGLIFRRKRELINEEEKKRQEAIREREMKILLAEAKAPKFVTEDLKNEQIIRNIFRGHFKELPFSRADNDFSILLNAYINQYSSLCNEYLPKNKIELTTQECATEKVTTDGWGFETGRECVSWRTVRTGIFASPLMYEAKEAIAIPNSLTLIGGVLDFFSGKTSLGDVFSGVVNLVVDQKTVSNDMRRLIRQNGCPSQALRRFETNLSNFSHNRAALKIED